MTALEFILALLSIAVALSMIMAGAWLVQQRTGNSGWVDTIWTFGLGAVGFASALAPFHAIGSRQIVVAVMIAVWAARLGLHIASRSRGITDDPRYAEMAREWGSDAPRQMFWLLQKQAWVTIPLALAVYLAAHAPAPHFRVQDFAAMIVMAAAIIGEGVADRQLHAFKADPQNKGRVCDAGLWAWSRHPNYFFEWLGWLACPLLAIDLTGAYGWGWLSLLAPMCMYWLLVYVSGIRPLEAHMLRSRGQAFRDYQARTNAFFPMPPGKRS